MIRLAPDSHSGYYVLARAVLEDSNFLPTARDWGVPWRFRSRRMRGEIALKYFRQAIEITPNDSHLHGYLAASYIELDELNLAIDVSRVGLRIDPEDELCLMTEMHVLHKLGQNDEAIAVAHRLLRLNPEHPAAHNLLGELSVGESGHPEAAVEHAETMIRKTAGNRMVRLRYDAIRMRGPGLAGTIARAVMSVSGLLRKPSHQLLILFVITVVVTTLRFLAVRDEVLLLSLLPVVGVVIALTVLVLGGSFTDELFLFAFRAVRPPSHHESVAAWMGCVAYVWLYPMLTLTLIGLWFRPHFVWPVIFLLVVVDLSFATKLAMGQGDKRVPFNWDSAAVVGVGVLLAPVSMLFFAFAPGFWSFLTIIPWAVVSFAILMLYEILYGINKPDGSYIDADRRGKKRR